LPKSGYNYAPASLAQLATYYTLAGPRYNTLINLLAYTIYYNKEGYFALSCLELKDIGDIKEIKEEKCPTS